VRQQEKQLRGELQRKQEKRGRMWPSTKPPYGRAQLLQDAKFSLVYAESGMWHESQKLLLVIDRFLVGAIGLDDSVSIRVRLFLSETYWWLGQPNEAVRLQQELLAACEESLGEENADTLNVKDRLGMSFWQQGKFYIALDFAQEAVDGFRKKYPSGHVDKSRALTNLGRCVSRLADFDQAIELHLKVLHGLELAQQEPESQYGDQISDVMENLAMARHDRHRYGHAQVDDLPEAEKLQGTVFEKYRKKLGKEHPKSLWAACNLARIKTSTGALGQAEDMIKRNLPVAERTIGADHIGTLMGKAYLGQVLTLAGKLDEAEAELSVVVATHQARDGQEMHPDHLVAAALLLDCCRCQLKHQLVAKMEKEVLRGIRRIFGEGSPWESYFVGQYRVSAEAVASLDI
jgi:tetratricopeptide (TPR) repeat protein